MKPPILKLYGFFVLLFAVLIGFTSYWSVFDAEDIRAETLNRRDELTEQRIPRGLIRADDGTVLARSLRRSDETYRRRYPTDALFGHPVGYSFARLGATGLEAFYNDELVGRRTELVTVLDSLLGDDRVGQDLTTTLDPDAQRIATEGLQGGLSGRGSVVAMDVETGAVRAMASVPGFDPNDLDRGNTFSRLSTDEADTPLFNRATQAGFPPGSTMKVVTATAAIDSGRYTPDSPIDGTNGKPISGVPLQNSGGQSFGTISLTAALTNSVNTAFAGVAEDLGAQTMGRYMDRYGFGARPPIDLPSDQLLRSGARNDNGNLIEPTSDTVDIGRLGIGQDRLLVTPLQMATVAQTVANGGVRMEPYLVQQGRDEDGRQTFEQQPEEAERVMSEESAAALTAMMQGVVREGTGTAAALSGVEVAGKTGTAELTTTGLNNLWFIGFTETQAVAVVVERAQGGSGGVNAAPIAADILESLG